MHIYIKFQVDLIGLNESNEVKTCKKKMHKDVWCEFNKTQTPNISL